MANKHAVETSALTIYLRLVAYIKPYRTLFILSVLGYAIYAAANVGYSQMMENLVNTIESDGSMARWLVPLQIIVLTLARGVGMFIGGYFMAKVAFNIINELRTQVFNHMTQMPVANLDARPSGHFVSLITYNINGVTAAATDALKKGIREGVTVIALLIKLFILDWKLTLIFISVAPLMGLLVSTVAKRIRRLNTKVQGSVGDLAQITGEMISGYKVMRSFGGEEYERQRFAKSSDNNFTQNMKIVLTSNINAPIMHMLIAFSMSMLIYAALSIMNMSTAEFFAYITAIGLIIQPIRQLGEVGPLVLKGVAAAESVFELLDEPVEKDEGNKTLVRAKGEVEFRNLSFSYPGQAQQAINRLNLHVAPGEKIALVGKSGSGKSTLVSLLPRFYDLTQGEILIDGIPQADLTLTSLREQIALVNQQVVLFEGSVADNIAYGRADKVSREAIKAAADLAHVSEFADKLPLGLDTPIGESGDRLSGGQRQRIAIARAILKDAPILILDEATSALDNESEHVIQAALEEVMKGRTTFIVAHRLSTIEQADRIVVMGEGEILEQGSHQELLALNGHYARLHSRQFKD